MKRREFLFDAGTMATLAMLGVSVTPQSASAGTQCKGSDQLTTHCTTITDQKYRGGGFKPKTVPIKACLPQRIYESIRLRDGTSAWEVGFYYGKGLPEVVLTVHNSPCWTKSKSGKPQTGHVGSYVVAFICCDYYCGWVGGKIPANGTVHLKPMLLPLPHDPMHKYRLPTTNRTGQYDRRKILH